jgi:citronellol/citronellal dehydrogenase
MFKENLFEGKTALVTGGGTGIGLEISRQLLALGAKVFIVSRKIEKLEAAVLKLHSVSKNVLAYRLDIRETENISHLADFIAQQTDTLDILINNAGGQFPSAAEAITEKGWRAVVETNLNGTWFVTQEMAKRFFLKQSQSNIVNIVLNNYRGFPGMAHSAAARAGVMNFTKTLAVEWVKNGVAINCVAPGIIQSSGLENYPPELLKGVSEKIPMRRLGTVEEVAELVLFLAHSRYISGETVYIDGAQRLWGDMWNLS